MTDSTSVSTWPFYPNETTNEFPRLSASDHNLSDAYLVAESITIFDLDRDKLFYSPATLLYDIA